MGVCGGGGGGGFPRVLIHDVPLWVAGWVSENFLVNLSTMFLCGWVGGRGLGG